MRSLAELQPIFGILGARPVGTSSDISEVTSDGSLRHSELSTSQLWTELLPSFFHVLAPHLAKHLALTRRDFAFQYVQDWQYVAILGRVHRFVCQFRR